MKLLGFFLVFTVLQTTSVRWLLQRPNPIWLRLATLFPALALPPAVLYLLTTFTIDPFAIVWVYLAIAGAISGFIGGLIWHYAPD